MEKTKRVDIRLSEEDYALLKGVSEPYGSVTNFVVAAVRAQAPKYDANVKPLGEAVRDVARVIKTQKEAAEAVKKLVPKKKNMGVRGHALNCKCFLCKANSEKN